MQICISDFVCSGNGNYPFINHQVMCIFQVTDNYRRFIETSKEIVHIESDLLNLSAMLHEYRSVVHSLQDPHAQFDSGVKNYKIVKSVRF